MGRVSTPNEGEVPRCPASRRLAVAPVRDPAPLVASRQLRKPVPPRLRRMPGGCAPARGAALALVEPAWHDSDGVVQFGTFSPLW